MIVNLKSSSKEEATLLHLNLLYKFHKLTDREIEIFIVLIKHYLVAIDKYKHKEAAAKLFMDQKAISTELGIKDQVFKNYLTALRKKHVLLPDGSLEELLIPKFKGDKLSLTFNIEVAEDEV